MSGFSAEWLALREPHDAAARDGALVEQLCANGAGKHADGAGRARAAPPARRAVVDLGCGSGANLRWLAPRLGGDQDWNLVDHDGDLLAAAGRALRDWIKHTAGPRAEREARDLGEARGASEPGDGAELVARGEEFSCLVRRTRLDLAQALARLELPTRSLVTSSALLDLVSERWLAALAHRCKAAAANAYFALTYDGRAICAPEEPEDAEVLALVNRHQRWDKGFGPALGPTAAQRAPEIFAALGYRVTARQSDWRIGGEAVSLQRELLAGWLAAAIEIAPERGAALRGWHERRVAHVDAQRSSLVVGHVDFVALHFR